MKSENKEGSTLTLLRALDSFFSKECTISTGGLHKQVVDEIKRLEEFDTQIRSMLTKPPHSPLLFPSPINISTVRYYADIAKLLIYGITACIGVAILIGLIRML